MNLEKDHDPLKDAIITALDKERTPVSIRLAKALILSTLIALIIGTILVSLWGDDIIQMIQLLCTLIGIGFFVGLTFWYHPEPKIDIPGSLSLFTISKLILTMMGMTLAQILICPDFAFYDLKSPFPIITKITDFYMSFGGMHYCMFLCGLTFSSLSAIASFLCIYKSFQYPRKRITALLFAVSTITLFPIACVQLTNEHSQHHFSYWISGSLLGLFILTALFSILFRRKKN